MDIGVSKTPSYDCETPRNHNFFRFPPDETMAMSVDRIRIISNYPTCFRSGRNFTPNKHSLLLYSPEISPIDFPDRLQSRKFVRMPFEQVHKVSADSTVSDIVVVESELQPKPGPKAVSRNQIFLMPPPNVPKDRKSLPASTYKKPKQVQYRNVIQYYTPDRPRLLRKLKHEKCILDQRISSWLSKRCSENIEEVPMNLDPNHSFSVVNILISLGLSEYIENFTQEQMDLEVFLTLTDEDLYRISIFDNNARLAILKTIQYFSS